MPADFGFEFDDNQAFAPEPGEDDAIWELLSLYMDGETNAAQTAQVEALLKTDAGCAEKLTFLRQTGDTVRAFMETTEVEPPAFLRDAIFAATTQRPTLARRLVALWETARAGAAFPAMRYALPAGAGLAAALALVALWPRLHAPTLSAPVMARSNVQPDRIAATVKPQAPSVARKTQSAPQIAALPGLPSLWPSRSALEALAAPNKTEAASAFAARSNAKRVPENLDAARDAKTELAAITTPRRGTPTIRLSANTSTPRLHPRTQTPAPLDSDEARPDYVAQPMMDDKNQRPVRMALASDSTSGANGGGLGGANFSASDSETAALTANGDKTLTTSLRNADNSNPIGSTTSIKSARLARIRQLALLQTPDSHAMQTNADFRREQSAEALGYDRDVVQSIHRRQASVSLFGSRF